MNRSHRIALTLAAMLLVACSSQRAPAEQAVADIDTKLSAIHDSAVKYSPEMLHSVEAQVATLKENLAKGAYQEVLTAAPAVNTAVAGLAEDTRAKQSAADIALAQTKQQWRTLAADVPQLITGLRSQLDTLSKARRLPKGVTKASLESAKTRVAALESMWTEATNAVSKDDNYADAVMKGQAVKDGATQLMQSLGMKSS